MPKAIVIEETGGPEVMRLKEAPPVDPGPGEIRIRQHAAGVNFIDIYFRTGFYKAPGGLPFVPGMEGAGVVDAVGPGVTDRQVGQRVAYPSAMGAYSELRILPAAKTVILPDAISFETAAGMMLKGLTAHYLLRQVVPLERGDTVLFHAASGGVGHIACQWARHLGIELIGTAGGPEKCARAKAAGAAHVIDYQKEDFVARVKEITGGKGVKAAIDGVGRDTFMGSLDCLRPFGMLVSYGQSSGAVPPFDIINLSTKGSLYVTRPTLNTFLADHDRFVRMAGDLFDVVAAGAVKIDVQRRYPLADAARAHADLEGRRTSGSSILVTT
ncbi:MAG TPA: quinone oxidoreductase [Polyangia bacterium]